MIARFKGTLKASSMREPLEIPSVHFKYERFSKNSNDQFKTFIKSMVSFAIAITTYLNQMRGPT